MESFLEELSLNAWPAVRQVHFDNWVLRFSGGHTRRANSVNFLGPSTLPLDFKIGFCEEAYSRLGSATVFKFAGVAGTERIEDLLAIAGYKVEGRTTLMTRSLAQICDPPHADFRIESELSSDWFEIAVGFTAVERSRKGFLEKILNGIVPAHGFASVWSSGKPVAIGMAVVERGWVGMYDIVTSESHRRQGHGTSLVSNLMSWGARLGAENAYLQVVNGNEPAIGLYQRLGFNPAYEYWYRSKDLHRRNGN